MSKTKRLIELMFKINGLKKFNVSDLASEFDVSYRTILRDLEELSVLGFPLYSEVGNNGGYYLLNERNLPPIIFSESEAIAVFFACQSLQFYSSLPFESETTAVLNKFYRFLPEKTKVKIDRMKDRVVFWNPFRYQSSDHLKIIVEAAIAISRVKLTYSSVNTTTRIIQPLGIYSYNGYWYVPSYCFIKKDYRLFRADRIRHVEPVGGDDSDHMIEHVSIIDWLTSSKEGEKAVPFILHLDCEGVRRARSDLFLGPLLIVNGDGTGTVDAEVAERNIEYVTEILWGLGTHVRIEEPASIIEHLKNKLTILNSMY